MIENYVNMLVYLDNNKTDLAGNEFPPEGYVQSKNFSLDKDLRNGIFGILNGNDCEFIFESKKIGFWAIVKTERSQLVQIVPEKYKFRCGFVTFFTSKYGCAINRLKKQKEIYVDSQP
tara:strand:+ start:4732 stop:5085 length:354 start_codon:yes stop_codon:yes gene_type:complete